jgi:hypothetical protein
VLVVDTWNLTVIVSFAANEHDPSVEAGFCSQFVVEPLKFEEKHEVSSSSNIVQVTCAFVVPLSGSCIQNLNVLAAPIAV